MAGKYDHLLPSLPRIERQDGDQIHQARINATKAIIEAQRTDSDFNPLSDYQRKGAIERVTQDLKLLHQDLARAPSREPLTAANLVRAWRDARDLKDALADLVSNTSLLVSTFEQLMIKAMEAEDTRSLKLLDGRGVNLHYEPGVKVVDLERLRQWCDADPDLRLRMRLMPATLESHVKQMMLAGCEPPPGVEVVAVAAVKKAG